MLLYALRVMLSSMSCLTLGDVLSACVSHTLHRACCDVGLGLRAVADGFGLHPKAVGHPLGQVSHLQPALPASPNVHCHHFAYA